MKGPPKPIQNPPKMQNGAIFQEDLYLNSENNFFSLLVFTGSQGSKKLAARAPPRRYFSDENEKA